MDYNRRNLPNESPSKTSINSSSIKLGMEIFSSVFFLLSLPVILVLHMVLFLQDVIFFLGAFIFLFFIRNSRFVT